MCRHTFIATRLLCGFSGSDKYINLNRVEDINTLYDLIMDGTIETVNNTNVIRESDSKIVRFEIIDKILNKSFPMHIKKQNDGLRFTLTEYIKYTKVTPGQIIIISITSFDNECKIFIEFKELYKYILEKHPTEDKYRIFSDNPPSDMNDISDNANNYLRGFDIIGTNDNSLQWSGKNCYSFIARNHNEKYIGVPFSSDLLADSFKRDGEIV